MWDKLVSVLGGNLFTGVTDLVKAFKLPPEQQILFEQKIAEISANTQQALEKIAADDRQSARQREIAVHDTTPKILAFSVVGGFLSMTIALIGTALLGYKIDPVSMGLIGTLVGYLSAKSELVLAYYFGSSSGSDKKTELLSRKSL